MPWFRPAELPDRESLWHPVRQEDGRIFGRFERGTTDAPGTGLGLYLVEEVARAHGGRVDLVTAEGRGSTFALVLPARPEETEAEVAR